MLRKGTVSTTGGAYGRQKRMRERLPDYYVRGVLRHQVGGGIEIPDELVDLKREAILLSRARKQLTTVIKEIDV